MPDYFPIPTTQPQQQNQNDQSGGGHNRFNLRHYGRLLPVGFQTLLDNLRSRGQTDPRLMNEQIAQIYRGSQSQQQATQGQLAQLGIQDSGVGQALSQAQGASGGAQVADLRAREAALAEQRKREDLDQLLRLLLAPFLQQKAQRAGIDLGYAQLAGQGGGTDWAGLVAGLAQAASQGNQGGQPRY